jgi:hypothetical protein
MEVICFETGLIISIVMFLTRDKVARSLAMMLVLAGKKVKLRIIHLDVNLVLTRVGQQRCHFPPRDLEKMFAAKLHI